MGIHTALDTNGALRQRLTDAELDTIDLVLLDIKSWDEGRHRQLTGIEVGPVLEFARRLAARKRPMWLRFVLVPGLTDDPNDIAQIASFTASLGNVERVDVLPSIRWVASNGVNSNSITCSATCNLLLRKHWQWFGRDFGPRVLRPTDLE